MKRMNIHVVEVTGKTRRVRRLLNGGFLPLHTAARYGRREIARLLLEFGADINAQGYRWPDTVILRHMSGPD